MEKCKKLTLDCFGNLVCRNRKKLDCVNCPLSPSNVGEKKSKN